MNTQEKSPLELSIEELDRIYGDTLELVSATERRILEGPVSSQPVDIDCLKSLVDNFDVERGGGDGALSSVLDILERFGLHNLHSRYMGLFNPAAVGWGQIADLITARLNPQLAVWSHAPAAVEIEQAALAQVAKRFGWNDAGSFFTSGGEEANRCAVQVALASRFPAYLDDGLSAIDRRPAIYASAESHLAWLKIAAATGLGRSSVRLIDVNGRFEMDADALARAIHNDRRNGFTPVLIVATAGTTSSGAIDPIGSVADLASREAVPLHIDAAWAGAVVMSDKWRGVLAGIERADSVTIDAHKWLSQPMGTGMFFARDAKLLKRTFAVSTTYMPQRIEGTTDFYSTSPQWSRPFRGLRLFLTLAVLGRLAYEKQIDRDVGLGRELAQKLEADGWRIVNATPLPLVCFTLPEKEDDVGWHDAVADHVVSSGEAWISSVSLAGKPALRACITSYRTRSSDLDMLVTTLRKAARDIT